MERLWAPWRLRYVEGTVRHRGCIFCEKPASGDDVGELIVLRGERAYLIMNLFPYNTGHVMAVPYQHAADLAELDRETTAELFELVTWLTAAQRRALRCEGFNIGLNLGAIAGAGISDHVHVHVVPRWPDDGAGSIHTIFRAGPRRPVAEVGAAIRKALGG
ncbi:MAG: HIT domain-containing protein [Thermomicrobium sp.]|nr:HIT domain-containing protein [Thermomicrobium sp.]